MMVTRILIFFVACFAVCHAEANIGCLFSDSVCEPGAEWCFDDFAFGQCLPLGQRGGDRFDLDENQLSELENEMRRLASLGYEWTHPLTQCVLQLLLATQSSPEPYLAESCLHLYDLPQKGPPAPGAVLDEELPAVDPRNQAIVRFEPSSKDPHPEFADEVYFPPITDREFEDEMSDSPYVFALEKKSVRSAHVPNTYLPPSGIFTPLYNTPAKFRGGLESKDFAPEQRQEEEEDEAAMARQLGLDGFESVPLGRDLERQMVAEIESNPGLARQLEKEIERELDLNPGLEKQIEMELDANPALERQLVLELENNPGEREALEELEKHRVQRLQNALAERLAAQAFARQNELVPVGPGFSREYNTPDSFRAGLETRDMDDAMSLEKILGLDRNGNEIPALGEGKVGIEIPDEEKIPPKLSPKLERLANMLYAEGEPPKAAPAYTEGGLVFLPDQPNQGDASEGLQALLGSFKRPERLDVKKPGPLFTAINIAEQHHLDDLQPESLVTIQTPDGAKDKPLPQYKLQAGGKKGREGFRPTPDAGQYDVVDTTFAYIGFKQSVTSWHEGRNIVRHVAELLELPPGTLSHTRVDRNEVTFKVEPNKLKMNSSEVARRIEGIKDKLKSLTGVEVTSAGIGDKTKLPTVLSLAPDSDNTTWMAATLLAGAAGAVVVAGTTLFFVRKTAKSRAKLRGLEGRDNEAAGDYQDLCRARVAGKSEPIGHRIASLSRESEASNNSPSSRSSTSSWSEEPALTNMDISTGHMVLSYMEDHLKNKDRLQQEWDALCAYEAEPCATVNATKPDNVAKNRYTDRLPYDHSRVVLNDLANAAGADYVNASTITDHDPRSPAYIATQGPLPQTTAHFWQLVWEQGSVVIVMLTRLTETGVAMCHRYWPEEGSELYHIYEVHLVSEHIWCDDYLVRSFYLKNLKTGETRTVTQFHFLSWCDEGVPSAAKPLLEFRRKVNKSYRGRSCPIVVHCSDGVGRTGTYVLIDTVLNRMAKGAKEIDIAATLEHIRDQRQGMVRTRAQFEFALTSVAEEVNAILKALPPAQNQPAVTPHPKE